VEKSWSIAPCEEPNGLALDIKNQRLFSVCSNSMMVVVDATNGKVITTLKTGEGTDGCAFDHELKRIYSSNGEGTLTIVQEENEYVVLENLQTKKGARTICINPETHHVYLPTAEFGETPKANEEHPHPRAAIIPNSFMVLDISTM
jgi:DNA-binding beta-propeller fold protein YncE